MTSYSQVDATFPPSPEDWIAARVHRLLSHDPKLSSFLANRIYLLRDWQAIDQAIDPIVAEGPVMHIAPHISSEPIEAPTHREMRTVETIVSLQWEEVDWEPVHPASSPSMSTTDPGRGMGTVLNWAWFLVAHPDNRGLKELRNDTGEEVQLVSPGHTSRSVQDLSPIKKDEAQPWILGLVMILRFQARVDVRTGKIETLS